MIAIPRSLRPWCAALVVGSAALLAACGGGGSDDDGAGALSVRLTDGQSCSYDAVFVTIEKVRVHRNANAAENADGWEELVLSPARRVDLMTLRNGAFQELGTLPLAAGDYSQVRLVLAETGNSAPYANQLTLEDGTQLALSTPSAQQSGLKVNVQMSIEAGETAELVLDFDPCKSVVKAGNSGNYNLKPVITGYFEEVSAIAGTVVDGAVVSAQVGGETVKSTVAAADGRFVLWPMVAGTYDVVVTRPTLANAALTGVVIPDDDTTVQVGLLTVPANNGTGEVPVSVSAAADLVATVSARQVVDADTTIEVASTPLAVPAGSSTGVSFTLAVGEPVSTPWVLGTAGYSFTAGPTNALGDYTIRAAADGFPTQNADVTGLAANAVAPTVNFSFPAP